LCCVVLCCVVLCCVVLCCVVLRCVVLCCVVLRCVMLWYVALCYACATGCVALCLCYVVCVGCPCERARVAWAATRGSMMVFETKGSVEVFFGYDQKAISCSSLYNTCVVRPILGREPPFLCTEIRVGLRIVVVVALVSIR